MILIFYSKTALTLLPIDCWMLILNHLKPGDVVAVSAVSQDLHGVALPFLYKHISWEWDSVPLTRILQLLRTVIQNPEYAMLIQHVTLVSPQGHVDKNRWVEKKVKDNASWGEEVSRHRDVVGLAHGIVENAKFPDSSKWKSALDNGNAYAFFAILLSRLHKVVSLNLDYSFVWKLGLPGLMLEHALFYAPCGMLSKFTHLITVDHGSNVPLSMEHDPEIPEMCDTPGYPDCNPEQFTAWFYLPSIQSTSIWAHSCQGVTKSLKQQKLENLKQVHTPVLSRSTNADEEIRCLLSHTPNLRSLHLGLAYEYDRNRPKLENPNVLLNALEFVSQTVDTLSMSVETYPFAWGE